MEAFLKGIMLGWGVSVPIGPVNVLIMSYALKSYTQALALGLGAMSADALYLILLSFGMLEFLNYPTFFSVLAVCGAIYLSYMAYDIYKNASNVIAPQQDVKFTSHTKTFIKGFFLNITNPYVIMFWLSIATVTASIEGSFVLALLGLVAGILSWITLFPLAIYKSRNLIGAKASKMLSYFSAIILLFFAFLLIYEKFIKGS
ncbi:LysE family translocator [Campylobacter geochelonis]|uniref:Amino acid transporter LysE n=1 Tax=Campylobacter geochelonis TaxID=1780362 RepID=A0A128EPT8_9BACT|nr:LysE family translocator [Campylobacter geochelonis]QKF70859.1 transporter, LysE family [Campylobacter geochelonis]CZE47488.1 amino acid transporter LysE [Campylobacter geochelonis]CZE47998.1 amino acid transporter LysE [Campylobacter geochelonis]CZE50624.1 amino acid transporter LysE [Campylobacter geochelonis]